MKKSRNNLPADPGAPEEVVVLFLDLRNFSNFSENFPRHEVIHLLDGCFALAGDLAHEFGGSVGQLSREGVMVFFSRIEGWASPELRAPEMALRLSVSFAELREDWANKEYGLEFGVGMAAGKADLASSSFAASRQRVVDGEVVEMALGLSKVARSSQTLIPRSFLTKLPTEYCAEPAGLVNLKSSTNLVEVYSLRRLFLRGDLLVG